MWIFFNEGNQIHNFISSSGSGSNFLTNYGSGSTSQKVTVPTVPVPVPQHCILYILGAQVFHFMSLFYTLQAYLDWQWLPIWQKIVYVSGSLLFIDMMKFKRKKSV